MNVLSEDVATRFLPEINRNRCEGKFDCVTVCPYGVLDKGVISAEQRSDLNFIGGLKAWSHGGHQAFVVKGDLCEGCGHCVKACPENAIRLVEVV